VSEPHRPNLPRSIEIALPYGMLISDNERIGVHNGRALLSKRYRAAKKTLPACSLRSGAAPVLVARGPVNVKLEVLFTMPDRRPPRREQPRQDARRQPRRGGHRRRRPTRSPTPAYRRTALIASTAPPSSRSPALESPMPC
jgi:hypothetical protein